MQFDKTLLRRTSLPLTVLANYGVTLIETFEYFVKYTANSQDSQKIFRSSLCFVLGMIAHFVTAA